MRLRIVLPVLALTAILFVLPYTALAETVRIPFLGPIVPEAINRCPASFAMFIDVINRIILFSLTIGIVFVAPIMIAYAGFLMVVNPFNSGGIQKAKDIMLHTVVGIVIALAGWLIVAALMAVLYSPTNGLKAWNTIISSGGLDACLKQEGALLQLDQSQVTGSTAGGVLTVVTPVTGNEAVVRAMFLAATGISINKSPCPVNTRYQDISGGCTTVGGLTQNVVAQVINLKNICGSLQVTGGNELGHADGGQSHTTGYKVDLAPNIDSCIKGGSGGYFSLSGVRGSNPRHVDKCGNEYVREPTHWDITVTRSCQK